MKRLVLMAVIAGAVVSRAATLEISIKHRVGSEELQAASLRYRNAAAESYSITRASWLVGAVSLERADGTWFDLPDHVQWIDFERGRTSLHLDGLPDGRYRTFRFEVGIKPELNHADVAQFDAQSPLNPNLNGLHWSWQGGYVFLALDGMWRKPGVLLDGWSFHLARNPNRVNVSLPVDLLVSNDVRLDIAFDLGAVLNGAATISFSENGTSTHSRDGDPLAAMLVTNLAGAFRVERLDHRISKQSQVTQRRSDLPKNYTPFRFAIPATFPHPNLPLDNPLIAERVDLGRRLFNETLLSRDGSISCRSCHDPSIAFSDTRRVSTGVDGRRGFRNSMPLFNLAWKSSFFWDGRAASLREQALMPIQDHAEMDESLTNVIRRLRASADYAFLFARAFDTSEITGERIGLALEQFLLTLTSFNSKFDRSLRGEETLTSQEQRGLELFMTEYDPRRGFFGADCFHCHGGALFQSQSFANNGLDDRTTDAGRGKVTGLAADSGKFATPSLRNVAVTPPYMHDGRFATLEDVVAHYSGGVKRSATLDPNMAKHPVGGLQLSVPDAQALLAFLKTLTDEQFSPLVRTNIVHAMSRP